MQTGEKTPPLWLLLPAFGAIYFIWGSSFVVARIANQTLPPLLMMGTRILLGGLIVYALALRQGVKPPNRRQWLVATVIGILLFLSTNGIVSWSVVHLPSGIVALMMSAIPMWMVVLGWLFADGKRPTLLVIFALALGFGGIAMLFRPEEYAVDSPLAPVAFALLLLSPVTWVVGSLISRRASMPKSPFMSTGMTLTTGGAALVLLSILVGDAAQFDVSTLTWQAVFAWAYLSIAGSVIGFSAYVWLLRVQPPSRVATYAYVNPIVALTLGALLAGEQITLRIVIAAATIITAVAIVTSSQSRVGDTIRLRVGKITDSMKASVKKGAELWQQ